MGKYEGAGYYDEYGNLTEKSKTCYREPEPGEVWEGDRAAWRGTFAC